MTEQEWLECVKPKPMLKYISHKTSDRKLRLFAAACCRGISHLLYPSSQQVLKLAEQFADGLVTKDQLRMTRETLREWEFEGLARILAYQAVRESLNPAAVVAALETAKLAQQASAIETTWRSLTATSKVAREATDSSALAAAKQTQSCTVRDIFGNPFRPFAFDPAWRTPSVVAVAQTMYDERRFEDMPILADALEEAGCTAQELLDHCRNGKDHVRGCWAVDLVLAKT
jgi:hypothetical protein